METQQTFFQWTRQNIMELLNSIDFEEVNTIPDGFNNNILWNVCHIHVVQQFFIYKLAGFSMDLSDDFFHAYVTGTKPKKTVDTSEFDFIKEKITLYAQRTIEDIHKKKFFRLQPFQGNYGIVKYDFKTFEEVFQYNNLHEALHLGYMMAIRRAIHGKKKAETTL